MKIKLEMITVDSEEDRDSVGLGSRPRLRSIVAGLTPEGGEKSDQEEWRPNVGESQFDCMVREFREQYECLIPDFFIAPADKPKPAAKSTGKGQKAQRKSK